MKLLIQSRFLLFGLSAISGNGKGGMGRMGQWNASEDPFGNDFGVAEQASHQHGVRRKYREYFSVASSRPRPEMYLLKLLTVQEHVRAPAISVIPRKKSCTESMVV